MAGKKSNPAKFNDSEVRTEFRRLEGTFNDLCREARYILEKRLQNEEIKIHDVQDRVKSIESVLAKAIKTECSDPISEIHDIAGLRIICLFRDDLPQLSKLIQENFRVISSDDKTESDDPLGYQSIHYICELPQTHSGARYEHISARPFEIQIRTLCMHCWATVSHYIDYKGDWDVPKDLKKALNALSGLFFVADSEFQQFNSARLRSKMAAEAATPPSEKAFSEINLDTMTAYLKSKFQNRKQQEPGSISELILDIKNAGFRSMAAVESDVNRAKGAFEAFEKDHPPNSGVYGAVGVVRTSLRITSEDFARNYRSKNSVSNDDASAYRAMLQ